MLKTDDLKTLRRIDGEPQAIWRERDLRVYVGRGWVTLRKLKYGYACAELTRAGKAQVTDALAAKGDK